MLATPHRALPALATVALALLAACGDDTGTTPLPPELQQLKEATTAYQDLAAAEAAGWDTPITPCWYDHSQGGMGYHYAKVSGIDGNVSLLEPEALMYEPQSDASMRLVGMEYIVPIDAWSGSNPPSLAGEEFTRLDALGIYALHIYLWKNNPDGMFALWNPDVSCQYADESEDLAAGAGAVVSHGHGPTE